MRLPYLTTGQLSPDDVIVGIDPRSITGELIYVGSEMTMYHCIYLDAQPSLTSLELDLAMSVVE